MRYRLSACVCAVALLASVSAAQAGTPAYAVTGSLAGADGGWDFAQVDPVRGVLYVARSNAVMAADLASGKVTPMLAPAKGAHQVLAIDGGKTLVETDGKSGLTRFIDAASGAVQAEVATGQKPDSAFFDGARVFVMSPGNDTIWVVDPASRQVVASMKQTGGLEFAVSNGKGGAFVNLEGEGKIAEVDPVAGKLLRKIALPGCEGPTGLGAFAQGTRLISACANGVAVVIDTASGKAVAHLPIGKDADAVLIDEPRALAFVPCGGNGTLVALSIADADHVRVAQVIPTKVGAKTGALDPRDGRIYLPTATLAKPEPGAKRGKPVPGSFTVLVVSPGA